MLIQSVALQQSTLSFYWHNSSIPKPLTSLDREAASHRCQTLLPPDFNSEKPNHAYEQFNQLKVAHSTIEEWYNNLDRFAEKKIIRYGNVNIENNGFYPDVE